jgi:hypothetical protein
MTLYEFVGLWLTASVPAGMLVGQFIKNSKVEVRRG